MSNFELQVLKFLRQMREEESATNSRARERERERARARERPRAGTEAAKKKNHIEASATRAARERECARKVALGLIH
jgi:hypothetical protein